MLTSSIAGLGLFYSGILRRKNALSMVCTKCSIVMLVLYLPPIWIDLGRPCNLFSRQRSLVLLGLQSGFRHWKRIYRRSEAFRVDERKRRRSFLYCMATQIVYRFSMHPVQDPLDYLNYSSACINWYSRPLHLVCVMSKSIKERS